MGSRGPGSCPRSGPGNTLRESSSEEPPAELCPFRPAGTRGADPATAPASLPPRRWARAGPGAPGRSLPPVGAAARPTRSARPGRPTVPRAAADSPFPASLLHSRRRRAEVARSHGAARSGPGRGGSCPRRGFARAGATARPRAWEPRRLLPGRGGGEAPPDPRSTSGLARPQAPGAAPGAPGSGRAREAERAVMLSPPLRAAPPAFPKEPA